MNKKINNIPSTTASSNKLSPSNDDNVNATPVYSFTQSNVEEEEESNHAIEISIIENEDMNRENEEIKENTVPSDNFIIVVNVCNPNLQDGWNLHYKYENEEIYYYYKDGIRIKKIERMANGKWIETDLSKSDVYEIGNCFDGNNRDGVYKKYKNDKLIEVNTYEKGKHVGFRQVITLFTMNEYDLNGHLIYCGGYKVKENDVYVRDDIGKEYCNNRIVFEGEWKDGIPDGYGKMYIDNDTCIEGIWNNGICSYSEKEYDYKNKTSRIINKKNALPLMWSEVIGIVLLFCYGSMSFCNTFDEDYLLYASYLVGIYSIALLIQQFSFSLYDKCWPLIGLVLLSSGMVLLIEVINKNEMFSMFIITTYMNIVSFIIYNYRFNVHVDNDFYSLIRGKPECSFVLIDILTCYIYPIHCFAYLSNSSYDDISFIVVLFDTNCCIICIVLAILYYNKNKCYGILISIVWCIIAIIIGFIYNKILLCFIINVISSILLYFYDKRLKKSLPVTHSSSSV